MIRPSTGRTSHSFLRALQVLEAVARAERPIGATELMHELGLPKPTAHRIVAMLVRANLIQRDAVARRLVVGTRLAALALDALARSSQGGPRHQILSRVAADTGETISLTVLDRTEILLIDRVESRWPLRVNLFPGSRVPLHCTASGKLMLAMLPEATRKRLIEGLLPLRAYTPNTITSPKSLRAALARIESEGYSTDDEEFMVGMVAVAVPVIPPGQRGIAATLSLNGPAARIDIDGARTYVPRLRKAARGVADTFRPEPHARIVPAQDAGR